MKVIQVLPDLNTGGVERGTVELSKALIEAGCSAYVISNGGVLVNELTQAGAIHIQVPVGKKHISSLLQVRKIRKIIMEIGPEIVHVRSRMPAWLVFLAMRFIPKSKRPIVVSTFHGMYSKPLYSQVMTFSDHIISVSETVREYIMENYQINRDKISMIHRGCDPSIFNKRELPESWKQAWYKTYPETQNKIILTLPARITKWKGIDTMIELISQLDTRFHALIVGPVNQKKQAYYDALQALIQGKGLQDRVTFCGTRSDIDEIYRLSSIVYNLSNQPEPFGRTVCEACNVGTKVIAWASGGPKESLAEMFPQGLVEPGNMQQLREKTMELAFEKGLEPKSDVFTTQKMTNKTIELYHALAFSKTHATSTAD